MFVIKFPDGTYYNGYNGWDSQLRNAKIYVSLKKCKESADYVVEKLKKGGYNIVKIHIAEVAVVV